MSWTLVFTEQYVKRAGKFIKRHPDLEKQYKKTLQLHQLSGRLEGLYSVSINLSYRITLEFMISKEEIIPVNVGDHDSVY